MQTPRVHKHGYSSRRRGTCDGKSTIHPLELPEANDLYPVVCEFMRKLNVRASPGFDCIAAPFIKYAEKEVPAVNGRGVGKDECAGTLLCPPLCLDDGKSSDP